jgi:PEGA domain-containing protein
MSDKPRTPPPAPPPVPPRDGHRVPFQDANAIDAIELDPAPLLVEQDDTEGGKYDPAASAAPGVSSSAPATSPSARKPLQLSPILWMFSGLAAVAAAGAFSWSAFDKPIEAAPPAPPPNPVQEIRAAKIEFSLVVDSKPTGATVFVDGRDVGRTPALLNLECTPGIDVAVRVEREGYETFTHTGECKTDAILSLKPKLKRLP